MSVRTLLRWVLLGSLLPWHPMSWPAATAAAQTVYILPVRDDIMPPLVYLVRRGVKEAMELKADLLVLDMETNGGRVDVTEEIIQILGQFKGATVTYVNRKAFSAGAFIAVATQKIYMAPQSVIGAAAPILLMPGTAPQEMPNTMEVKMTSGIRALVRTAAEKNGHNVDVIEAMIDKSKELKIEGKVLNEKGQILTLTNKQAEEEYGEPRKPLLSLGTVESLDALLETLGYAGATRKELEPTGAEQLGIWINAISPLLLIIGVVGIYLEFKTPGFGLPGIIGIVAFALYFFGGYVAGLSGLEWLAVFVAGLALVALELFLFPGTLILGFAGAALMLLSILMAMVDMYPGMPPLPSMPQLQLSLSNLGIALAGSIALIVLLGLWLPRTAVYGSLVSQSTSGVRTLARQQATQQSLAGQIGVALSILRPGGKARFGDAILDVITQGEMLEKGRRVKVIGFSGREAIVEPTDNERAG